MGYKMEYDCQKGEEAVYTEEYGRLHVKVLENSCTGHDEVYRLRVIRTLAKNRFGRTLPDGHEFVCSQPRSGGYIGRWSLESLSENDIEHSLGQSEEPSRK